MRIRIELRRVTRKFSLSHRKDRIEFCLDQESPDCRTYRTCTNTIHVHETWLYVVRDREEVRMFPGERSDRSRSSTRAIFRREWSSPPSHARIPPVASTARSECGGCASSKLSAKTAQLTKGKEYECDVAVGYRRYKNLYTKTPLPIQADAVATRGVHNHPAGRCRPPH